jgi:TatA/E family protein of Tat protein translocase
MFGLGLWEMVLIGAGVLLIFGAGALPALGRRLGETTKAFREVGGSAESGDRETGAKGSAQDLLSTASQLKDLRTTQGKLRFIRRLFK